MPLLLLLLLVPLALAGCGEPEGSGRIQVDKVLWGPPSYIEGSLTEVTLRDGDGRTLADVRQRELGERSILARTLPAGDYELIARERPCQGNCGILDPPGPRCELDLEVRRDRTTRVVIQMAGGALECHRP